MWKVYLLEFVVVVIVSILWVRGITKMHEEHPDYKGDDLFGGFDFDNKEEEEYEIIYNPKKARPERRKIKKTIEK